MILSTQIFKIVSFGLICGILAFEASATKRDVCVGDLAKLNSIENLPAYSKDSDVHYFFESRGLTILLKLGPSLKNRKPGPAKEFELKFDPSKFWPGSLMRRAFGSKKLVYTLTDVRDWSTSYFTGAEGEVLNIYLRHPLDIDRTLSDGPLLMLDRKTGQIILYPAGTNADTFSVIEFIHGLWTETQQKLGRRLMGTWMKSVRSSQ
ncbi:MAG: hypothetical protein JWQ35_2275 [Bacteriovoracaceae bacterium]|nr:hypothetical protein [Bacteriovoracaceae bacterium]